MFPPRPAMLRLGRAIFGQPGVAAYEQPGVAAYGRPGVARVTVAPKTTSPKRRNGSWMEPPLTSASRGPGSALRAGLLELGFDLLLGPLPGDGQLLHDQLLRVVEHLP